MKAWYMEERRFDGQYRPVVVYEESKPGDKTSTGQRRYIQNVHQVPPEFLDERPVDLKRLHDHFNPPQEAAND